MCGPPKRPHRRARSHPGWAAQTGSLGSIGGVLRPIWSQRPGLVYLVCPCYRRKMQIEERGGCGKTWRLGAWDACYGHLEELPEVNFGYRLVVAGS